MVASMEAFVPILSSMIYSNLYNATIELAYPWQGSFYFLSIGLTIIGNISAWINPVKHRSHVCAGDGIDNAGAGGGPPFLCRQISLN